MVFTVFRQMNKKEVQEPAQAHASDDAMSTGASTNYQQSTNTQAVEEEKAMVPVYQYVKMQAEILRVPDQAKFAVQFTRKSGAALLFYENVKDFMRQL